MWQGTAYRVTGTCCLSLYLFSLLLIFSLPLLSAGGNGKLPQGGEDLLQSQRIARNTRSGRSVSPLENSEQHEIRRDQRAAEITVIARQVPRKSFPRTDPLLCIQEPTRPCLSVEMRAHHIRCQVYIIRRSKHSKILRLHHTEVQRPKYYKDNKEMTKIASTFRLPSTRRARTLCSRRERDAMIASSRASVIRLSLFSTRRPRFLLVSTVSVHASSRDYCLRARDSELGI